MNNDRISNLLDNYLKGRISKECLIDRINKMIEKGEKENENI